MDSELWDVGGEVEEGGREEFKSSLRSLTITSVFEWNLLLCRKMPTVCLSHQAILPPLTELWAICSRSSMDRLPGERDRELS